jgi:peptidoglycan/LPS O-acetylase OafA/YrhL
VHVPIIQLIIFVDVRYCKLGVWPTFAWVAVLTMPLTLVASYLLYRYVESPAIDLGKSLWQPRPNGQGAKALAT